MGKMPEALRETIARNIRDCRMHKFPGRGGGKRCAESFGVSPQQWSPWESGKRTPDELRLEQIALFFGTTVEWFRKDHRFDHPTGEVSGAGSDTSVLQSHTITADTGHSSVHGMPPFAGNSTEQDIGHYLWLLELLTKKLTNNGVRVVVTFEKQ